MKNEGVSSILRTGPLRSSELAHLYIDSLPWPFVKVQKDCSKRLTDFRCRPENGDWPVKRRRAMLESTPSRNSRLQTHQDDDTVAGLGTARYPG
jgi:hypothetical protein